MLIVICNGKRASGAGRGNDCSSYSFCSSWSWHALVGRSGVLGACVRSGDFDSCFIVFKGGRAFRTDFEVEVLLWCFLLQLVRDWNRCCRHLKFFSPSQKNRMVLGAAVALSCGTGSRRVGRLIVSSFFYSQSYSLFRSQDAAWRVAGRCAGARRPGRWRERAPRRLGRRARGRRRGA